jgi:phosphoribosyl 1,2-cyclic phosphodiesterase
VFLLEKHCWLLGVLLTCAVPVRLTILGSGSSGNCAYLETDQTRILIDAGLSLRQIRKRLATIGRTPECLNGVLITHEHSDHIQGLAALTQKLRLPVYCNRPTKDAIEFNLQAQIDCRLFTTRNSFDLGDLTIETFEVLHDAQDPVGFLVRTAGVNIGILTDLGQVTKLVLDRLRQANVLLIEANHDIKMLQDCPHRPWSLKQRILSRHGHLSNEAAADAVEQLMSPELRHLYLGHLSRECNKPETAHRVVNDRLQKMGAAHVQLSVASQNLPCPTLQI